MSENTSAAVAAETKAAENSSVKENASVNPLDEFLKVPGNQSEFDKRVEKALATARAKWEGEKSSAVQEAVTEAQRLAAMTAEQKAQHERAEANKALAKREAEITRRELKATARDDLSAAGLPLELAECLNYTDAKACNASMEAVKKAFTAAVSRAVDERLKTEPPRVGAGKTNSFETQLRAAAGLK